MISLERSLRLLQSNLSLITIGEGKKPLNSWKRFQTELCSRDNWISYYNNPQVKGIGICTGYSDLECIDIDLKVLPSLKLQQDFWNEYISFLKDNIDDFDDKFVIYKTVNNGYHIIYRCEEVGGNIKIAKLQGQAEAIIETRGKGGYIFVYENQVSKKDYTQIPYISKLDREVLLQISKTYDFKEQVEPVKVDHTVQQGTGITAWDDYNAKVSILDLISDSFDIVRNISDKYLIKRYGASSAHSGYVYKNSGCMYLFSTGTIYPNEKLLSPFAVYAYKNCGGDFSQAAKELYANGYGARIVKEVPKLREKVQIEQKDLVFPIDIFPLPFQNYIIECNKTLDSSIDYMGCSMLWVLSVIIGNSIRIEVKNGWQEVASVWIAVVGKAGVGKTPSIANIVQPLMKLNNKEIKNYIKNRDKFDAFMSLDKKEKEYQEEIKMPKKSQFIVNDITIEALVDLHEESKNSVGVLMDELAAWWKSMNKYRQGADLEFWLSSWSGKSVNMNRKTSKSSFVDSPCIPVLGGIQPSILDQFYTEENKDNGFIDRVLLCYPELEVDKYNEKEIEQDVLFWFNDSIVHLYNHFKTNVLQFNPDNEIEPIKARFTKDAKEEWKRVFNDITEKQNSDTENEYLKSMLPKQKSYIPRFALLINTIHAGYSSDANLSEVTKESVIKAEKLSKYFIAMAKKIKVMSIEKSELKQVAGSKYNKPTFDRFKAMYELNPNLNKSEAAEILGVTRQQIYNYVKELSN